MTQSHDYIKPFQDINNVKPPKSIFALDYYVQGSCSQGKLIPVYKELVVPGDEFSIGVQSVVRLLPMLAPAMTEINIDFRYFFVPLRLLWNNTKDDRWTAFINQSYSGDTTPAIPLWNTDESGNNKPNNSIGSLWDYFGFPTNINLEKVDEKDFPTDFLRRGYNLIYNEYFRDQNLIPEVSEKNEKVLNRAWAKDYFTSALPWQQKGDPPYLPIQGKLPVYIMGNAIENGPTQNNRNNEVGKLGLSRMWQDSNPSGIMPGFFFDKTTGYNGPPVDKWGMSPNYQGYAYIDLKDGVTFTISEFNLAYKVQRWLELNARGGSRYTEYLKAHWNVSASDARLQRPEYIGGAKAPIIISEVLQTSQSTSTSAQGALAGHGITASDNFIGTYEAEEHGIIIGLMSIMPKAVYSQGMPRKWTQRSHFDFYEPLFAHLAEQPILNKEIYLSEDKEYNNEIFGYQGRWDEYRTNQNQVCGKLRGDLAYWTQQRIFSETNKPKLNDQFINCNPSQTIFADISPDAHNFIYTVLNLVKAKRPMPAISDPSLLTV